MSRHTSTSWHEDRGFGKYLEEAAVERTGHAEERDEGSGSDRATTSDEQDESKPPRTGRAHSPAERGFGKYLRR